MHPTLNLAQRDGSRRRHSPLVLVAAVFGACLLLFAFIGPSLAADLRLFAAQYGDDYYAVYLDSGNVFYGHVRGVGLGKIVLADAYSFQSIEVGENSTNSLTAVRENPLTRPDNWIVLQRRHILFYERIGSDASVLEALDAR